MFTAHKSVYVIYCASCRWTFLIRRIDGLQWLAFIVFGSRGPGLVDRGLHTQNAMFIPNKYIHTSDVTASINARDANVCVSVSVRYWDQRTLFIHPRRRLPSGRVRAQVYTRGAHANTRRHSDVWACVN